MKKYLSLVLVILAVMFVACGKSSSNPVSSNDETDTDGISDTIAGIKMVFVEAGTFQMGSDTTGDNDKPVHAVTISKDYYIGQYEVTNEELVKVFNKAKKVTSSLSFSSTSVSYGGNELLNLDGSKCQIGFSNDTLYVKDNKEKYPAFYISWFGATAFAEFMNTLTGLDKYRLPTEAEWEFAARGGNKSCNYTYSGSNTIENVAWYSDNSTNTENNLYSGKGTHIVGTKSANELGLYDMSGNVYEWCSDWFGSYSSDSQTNPTGPSSGTMRILRGGCFFLEAISGNSRVRFATTPSDVGTYSSGFRVVREK